MTAGRPSKPTTTLEKQGTKRKHRHDARADKAYESAQLKCPQELSEVGKEHWKRIVDNTPSGVLTAVDHDSLLAMCLAWQVFVEYSRPADRKEQMQMSNAFQMWYSLACKFGLTPADRAKLRLEAEKEQEADPFVELMKARMN